jgi:DNA-3-methyladenine glycosylase I
MSDEPSASPGLRRGADGLARCWWCGDDPLYVAYHDGEWGRPVTDDAGLFERVSLEGFQAGLSWLTILRKREAFREVFAGFDPATVAGFGDEEVGRFMGDARIVRNRAKIEATIGNARALLAMHAAGERLADLVAAHRPAGHTPPRTPEHVPAVTPESRRLSRGLKARGFRFVGPTTCYAMMQAVGVVDDHLVGCHARGVGAAPAPTFT